MGKWQSAPSPCFRAGRSSLVTLWDYIRTQDPWARRHSEAAVCCMGQQNGSRSPIGGQTRESKRYRPWNDKCYSLNMALKRLRALRLWVIHQALFGRPRASTALPWELLWFNSLAGAPLPVQAMGCDSSGPAIGLMLPRINIVRPNCVGLISAISEGLYTLRLRHVSPFVDQMIYEGTRTLSL